MLPQSEGGRDFYGCKLSSARKARTRQCWIDAMVNITQFMASRGKYSIMSSKALQHQCKLVTLSRLVALSVSLTLKASPFQTRISTPPRFRCCRRREPSTTRRCFARLRPGRRPTEVTTRRYLHRRTA